MLPNSNSTSRTVFINPNFKTKTHFNPNFLVPNPNISHSIHVNPEFLEKIKREIPKESVSSSTWIQSSVQVPSNDSQHLAKIIEKSNTKLVRGPIQSQKVFVNKNFVKDIAAPNPMLKIGSKKLVRLQAIEINASNNIATSASSNYEKAIYTNIKGKYKLDRRKARKKIKRSFVSRFALRRSSDLTSNIRTLSAPRKYRLKNNLSLKKSFAAKSNNKNLKLLSINGVFYKSTGNKLQRSDTLSSNKPKLYSEEKKLGERVLFIRGNKFILDRTGLKMTKVNADNKFAGNRTTLRRIDIGGLTYVAKSNSVFVRTDIHMIRNHLSLAKQKSIKLLSNRFAKSNVPCSIYQKLGKCASFDRNRCPKVHKKDQVAICAKFLKSECLNVNCLLSHNVSLSKMPVCKFFLQGLCVRQDCQYLHKKLSDNAEICPDFIKGFCSLADKCNKRHEFRCPDFESKGKCEKINCVYCRKKTKHNNAVKNVVNNNANLIQKIEQSELVNKAQINTVDKNLNSRYFTGDKSDNNDKSLNHDNNADKSSNSKCTENADNDAEQESNTESDDVNFTKKRPKLGELPAFIPLSKTNNVQ